jgi:hypothetical protein
MAAEILRLEDYPDYVPHHSSRMTIPLQTTIAKHMQEKMGWPVDFCTHYAERFWNHYQAQGWKLSNGNPMKDWKAAFASQWKTPKQDEDRKLLEASIKKQREEEQKVTPEQYLNRCLDFHKEGKYKPTSEEVLDIYDWLKGRNMLQLSPDEVETIVAQAGNSKTRARMLAVRVLFDRMNRTSKRF